MFPTAALPGAVRRSGPRLRVPVLPATGDCPALLRAEALRQAGLLSEAVLHEAGLLEAVLRGWLRDAALPMPRASREDRLRMRCVLRDGSRDEGRRAEGLAVAERREAEAAIGNSLGD